MSLGIYPVFNPPVPDASFDGLGEVLAIQFDTLAEFAREHGFTPITAFADTREIPADFDGPPEDLESIMGAWKDWFDCREGRVAFESLSRFISDNPAATQALETPESVARELRSLAQALAVGERYGARFRLEMS